MSDDEDSPLPQIGANALAGQKGEVAVETTVLNMGFLYERRGAFDFGVDGTIELVRDSGDSERHPTGRQIGVQVKRGLSYAKQTRYGRTLYCTEAHANYWLGHSLPIIVVHCEPETDRLRWAPVNTDTLRETRTGYAIDIPELSDLRTSGPALKELGIAGRSKSTPRYNILILPYNFSNGITLPDGELGLSALEASRRALRGEKQRIDLEIEGEADLVASIDAIYDLPLSTAEERRNAIIQADTLHIHRTYAKRWKRALTLLLTDRRFAEVFGYNEEWLAAAIRQTVPPQPTEQHYGTRLDGWPGPGLGPSVPFHVPDDVLEEFYAREKVNRAIIRLGNIGGVMVNDLPDETIATRFLPALALRLITYADAENIDDAEALDLIQIEPRFWLIGIG